MGSLSEGLLDSQRVETHQISPKRGLSMGRNDDNDDNDDHFSCSALNCGATTQIQKQGGGRADSVSGNVDASTNRIASIVSKLFGALNLLLLGIIFVCFVFVSFGSHGKDAWLADQSSTRSSSSGVMLFENSTELFVHFDLSSLVVEVDSSNRTVFSTNVVSSIAHGVSTMRKYSSAWNLALGTIMKPQGWFQPTAAANLVGNTNLTSNTPRQTEFRLMKETYSYSTDRDEYANATRDKLYDTHTTDAYETEPGEVESRQQYSHDLQLDNSACHPITTYFPPFEEASLLQSANMLETSATSTYQRSCLGPPYIYVTYHGGKRPGTVHNVCRYTRDGCSLGAVLVPSHEYIPRSLRGLLITPSGSLIVGESWRMDSKILKYSDCIDAIGNRRRLESIVVSNDKRKDVNRGLLHPYGLANDAFLYVSVQGKSEVLRYNLTTGAAAPHPPSFRSKKGDPGAFYVLRGKGRPRGIAVDPTTKRLYIAAKQTGIVVLEQTGSKVAIWDIPNPISVWLCEERKSIFVGSSTTNIVYELDITTGHILQEISHPFLRHPAGIVGFDNELFVVSQKLRYLLKFSMNGEFLQTILANTPDAGERIILSDC